MEINKVIEFILEEVQFRTSEGIIDFKKPSHISILSEVLTEMGIGDIKDELIKNLTEGIEFRNSVLDKEIEYRGEDGETKKNMVGNLMRLPDDDPGRIAAEKQIPKDPAERKKIMNDLGSENQPGRKDTSTDDSNIDAPEDTEQGIEPEIGTSFKGEQGDKYREDLPDDDPAAVKGGKKKDTETHTT